MNTKLVMSVCTGLMLIGMGFGFQVSADDQPGIGSCEDNFDTDANVQCEVTFAPGGVTVKPVLGVGAAVCDSTGTIPPDFPLNCETEPGTSIANAGGVSFDPSAQDATQSVSADIWITWTGSTTCVTDPGTCGFEASLCNDRDLNSFCTNVGDQSDQLFDFHSNPELLTTCGTADDDKGTKCDDNLQAELRDVCLLRSEDDLIPWADDQIVIFLSSWVSGDVLDAPDDTNIGAGVTAGAFEVWIEFHTPGCEPPTPTIVPQCSMSRIAVWNATNNDNLEDVLVSQGCPPFDPTGTGDPANRCLIVDPAGEEERNVQCNRAVNCPGNQQEAISDVFQGPGSALTTKTFCGATVATAHQVGPGRDAQVIIPGGSGAWSCDFKFNSGGDKTYHARGECRAT